MFHRLRVSYKIYNLCAPHPLRYSAQRVDADALSLLSRKLSTSSFHKMPKHSSSKPTQQPTKQSKPPPQPVYEDKNGDIIVRIQAKPGSKTNAITDINDEGVSVQIAAPAIEGEANAELIKYISSILEIKKNEVSLDRGSKSRTKLLTITNKNASVEGVLNTLNQELNEK